MAPLWQRAPMRPLLLLVFALGCSATVPPPPPATPEPEPGISLEDQVLYGPPLDSAPESIRSGWATYEQAWASEPPLPPEGAGGDAYRTFAVQQFAPYVDAQVSASSRLLALWEEASDPGEKLVHSVLAARLLHRSASWMWTLPLPDMEQVNEAARAALEQSIRGAAQNFARYAGAAFGKCVEAANSAPAFEPWQADCAQRAESLGPIQEAQIGPPPPTPMPEGCEDHTDPMHASPQHDADARPQLLVLVDAETEGVDSAAVQRAVERWARSEHQLRAVPAGRRRAAQRLVDASKTSRRGPECAAAPSLSWVLGAQVPNLVVAKVNQTCRAEVAGANEASGTESSGTESSEACDLLISWHRAGSANTEGLPTFFRRTLPSAPTTEGIIESLAADPPQDSAILGILSDGNRDGGRVAIGPVENSRGYRLRSALAALELGACQAERGANQLNVGWTITATGSVESVTVDGGDESVRACVKEKLETLALTCTPSGEPVEMRTSLCMAR